MEEYFSEVIDILSEDEMLVKSRLKFSNKLKIPRARIDQLLTNYRQGVVGNYELMDGIMKEWIQLKGDSATITELRRILTENGFRSCADNLSQLDKTQPEVSNIALRTSTALGNVEESIQFGFKNVARHFTGRAAELNKLRKYFKSDDCPIVVLTGMGGVGKTQLATKFALTQNVPVKFWLLGENKERLIQSLTSFFRTLSKKNPSDMSIEQTLTKIFRKLKDRKWLVVIDNVDDIYEEFISASKTLQSFGNQVFLLVTSRRRDIFPGQIEQYQLSPLTEEDSLEFVKKSLKLKYKSSDRSIKKLCELLGNFPLALEQATAYIREQKVLSFVGQTYSIIDYLGELSQQETVGLSTTSQFAEYPVATIKVWDVTLDKIKIAYGAKGTLAIKVLDLITFLRNEGISIQFMNKLCSCIHLGTDSDTEESLKLLIKYSLITSDNGRLFMHRLLHLALKQRLLSINETMTCFWTYFDPQKFDHFEIQDILQMCKQSYSHRDLDELVAPKLHLFNILRGLGLCSIAHSFATEACEFISDRFGRNNVNFVLMERCSALEMKGDDGQLHKLKRIYAKLKIFLEQDHEETLLTEALIARAYFNIYGRKSKESLEWCHKLLKVFNNTTPSNEVSVKTRQKIAETLEDLARLEDAVGIYKQVLAWQKQNLGFRHPLVLLTTHRIATCYFKNKNYPQAHVMYQELLSQEEELYGVAHWQILDTKNSLIQTLQKMGCDKKILIALWEEIENLGRIVGGQGLGYLSEVARIRKDTLRKELEDPNNQGGKVSDDELSE